MKLLGILSWYDERPSWLAGVIASLAKAEIAHLVAVDGAYSAYPNGKAYSGPEQHAAIVEVCRALEMGCTIHTPREPWFGNEVEKRNYAFRIAESLADPLVDWYFLADADHFVTSAMGHMQALERAEEDVAEVRFSERLDGSFDMGGCPLRCVFRAVPGLHFETNHFTYRLPDGRNLHAPGEPVCDLSMVEVEHRTQWRDSYRKERQQTYYRRRDELGLELPKLEDVKHVV